MKQFLHIMILAALAVGITGCASLATRGNFMSDRVEHDPRSDFPAPVYPGTMTDISMTGIALSSPVSWIWTDTPWWMIVTTPLFLVDLPLSFAADTVCLPSDIFYWWNPSIKSKKESPIEYPWATSSSSTGQISTATP